jgi:hypothetical protein
VLAETQDVHFSGPLEKFRDLARAICNDILHAEPLFARRGTLAAVDVR